MSALAGDMVRHASRAEPEHARLIVFAGGGTAGHLYPALATVGALRARMAAVRFVFFGTQRPIDAQVLGAADEELIAQEVQPLSGRPWGWPAFLRAWRRSTCRCRAYFAAHPPAIVIGTGGFASGPAICVAAKLGVPTALLNPDLSPGRANRYLASRVARVFAQWPETRAYFGPRVDVVATGCPVRAEFASATRAGSVRRFGLDPTRRTLLITGASLGAHSINAALAKLAPALAGLSDWQVLHLTGSADLDAVRVAYVRAGVAAKVLAYTEQMAEAMAVADLIVSRAGASTLAEIAALGKPAILLPYPYHRDRHQEAQANLLARRGAARVVRDTGDGAQTVQVLRGPLFALLTGDAELAALQRGAAGAGVSRAAENVAAQIEALVVANRVTKRG